MKLKLGDNCYGTVGERTGLRDSNGDNLYIGDVVNVKCKNMPDFLSVTVKNEEAFVMGIRSLDIETSEDFKVYKEKSYASMKVGDEVHNVKYVEDTEEYLNKPIQVQVIDVDKDSKKLILSAKEILRAKAEEERKNKVSNLEIGLVTEGTVESLQPYGAFVDLGNGLSGLVHISQICEKRIKKPSEVLAVGDKVKVKVTAIKDGKLSLSIKEASDMMAKEIEEEVYEVPDAGQQATTSLGSLFANIKLD